MRLGTEEEIACPFEANIKTGGQDYSGFIHPDPQMP